MIAAEDLTKRFEDFTAVDGISLNVQAGEVLALLGPNGAGKTTTIRMLTSVLRPTRGWARIAGFDVIKQATQVRAAVGVLTEQHGLYGRMPADEYLDFFGQLYNMEPNQRRMQIEKLLTLLGLFDVRKRKIGEYSKGMRQKLALARAIMHDPPVLLLDEPSSAMDPQSARLVRDAILQLRSNHRAIIICTHNLVEAEELADQIAIIRGGKIITTGTPDHLKQELLGPKEYEVVLTVALNGSMPVLPPDVTLTEQGENWFRFKTNQPALTNPSLLNTLQAHNLPVITLQEVPRSLEQVYLQAINAPLEPEMIYA